jgi:V/A-type H+-transporting ATPase subunit E
MGLEEVKEEIIRKAKDTAEEIISEGRKEAERIADEAKEKIRAKRKEIEAELKKIESAIKKKEIASSELEIKKMFLEEKKRAIENVFGEAKKKLGTLGESQRKEHVRRLIEKAQKEIDVACIYCNKKDKKFIKDFRVAEDDILGGIIAEDEKGDVRVDYSYETILGNVKERYLQNIGKILFG